MEQSQPVDAGGEASDVSDALALAGTDADGGYSHALANDAYAISIGLTSALRLAPWRGNLMQYLLTPLHAQFDSGFGATANAFKHAADHLDTNPDAMKDNLFNANLPVNFLYRHAIELFLKSAIVIFHRKFQLPYGDTPATGEPMVLVDGKWKPFRCGVHSPSVLWTYVKQLFAAHAEWLSTHPNAQVWSLSDDIDKAIQTVEEGDSKSTFFRYPTTNNSAADVPKSAMKEVTESEMLDAAKGTSATEGAKGLAFVVQNEAGEFVRGYVFENDQNSELNQALRQLAAALYDLHAAMRWEICGGN
jgi:hypothetical protein